MKEHNTKRIVVVGLDLGDKHCQFCGVNGLGEPVLERRFCQTRAGMDRHFQGKGPWRVVVEAGTPTRWIKKHLESLGHQVKVVNPRKMRVIYENDSKSDVVDARELAEGGLSRWNRLPVVTLRGDEAQGKLAVIKTRDLLVRSRTALASQARAFLKQEGLCPPKCTPQAAPRRLRPMVPDTHKVALEALLTQIDALTERIKALEEWIEQQSSEDTAIQHLRSVRGVGPITAAAYVWTLDDPGRFAKSRSVGAYLGLRPRRDQSGEVDRQLRITKAGNGLLRRLLVSCAQYILGPFGPDTALRRWGLGRAARGGRLAKAKAVVGVARKLAVILHHLWVMGEEYEPFPESTEAAA